MGILSFFKRKDQSDSNSSTENESTSKIPENIFIEKLDLAHGVNPSITLNGILAIYQYLQSDFESKGYNDAMTSPDDKYKQDNLKLIKYDLEIIVSKVKTYHDSMLKEIDFHIDSRGRAGLIDLVEELKSKREDLIKHVEKVKEIEVSLKTDTGLFERATLAYQRGFTKGLASITQSSLLSKQF